MLDDFAFRRSNSSRWKIYPYLLTYLLIYLLTYRFNENNKFARIFSSFDEYRKNVRFFFRELILQQIKISRAKLAANCWIQIDRYWNASSRWMPAKPISRVNRRFGYTGHDTTRAIFQNIEEDSFLVVWWKYFLLPKSMPKSFVCTYSFLYTRSYRRAALPGNYSIRSKRERKGGEVRKHVHGEYTRAHLPL